MTTKTNKKGFTIIEVVLVLAIAGLIFLMVFLAFPALQRSQSDTQRRQDYSQLFSGMSSYLATLNGRIPTEQAKLDPAKFMNKTGLNPDGIPYKINIVDAKNQDPSTLVGLVGRQEGLAPDFNDESVGSDVVYVVFYATCGADPATNEPKLVKSKNKKDFAVWAWLASSDAKYCQSTGNE